MMITVSLMMIPPIMLPMVKHPLAAGFLLLSEMILIILTVSLTTMTFWYSYITFLIMIGGMLVLFMYMTSVASNEKFKFSWTSLMMVTLILIWMIIPQMNNHWMNYSKIINMEKVSDLKLFLFSLNKFLNEPSYTLSIMLIIYLLITMIAVIKIVNINLGPIRHMN